MSAPNIEIQGAVRSQLALTRPARAKSISASDPRFVNAAGLKFS